MQLDPESVEARINLGAAYLAAERYEDAELVYELLIQQTGGDADTLLQLGLVAPLTRARQRGASGVAALVGLGLYACSHGAQAVFLRDVPLSSLIKLE